jgi:hypothetical protein
MSMKSITRPLCALVAMTAISIGTGCANQSPADLRLKCDETGKTYQQQFKKAYVSQDLDGTEVVLTSDDANASIRQLMHVRVLWRPQRGTKQGHPSYTNAALRWYVFGAEKSDVLEYSGAGFVQVADTAGGTKVVIRNADVKPVAQAKGSLNDPVGSANLTGTFYAEKSTKRVNELLAEINNAMQNNGAQQASAQ